MADALAFSAGSFMQCTVATSSTTGGTIYEILSATSSSDRRVYGISVVSVDNGANPVKIYLHDGTSTIQVCNVNVPANSGNTTTAALTDIFSSTMAESVLAKNRDSNGVIYFNLPKNWSIKMSFQTTHGTSAEKIYTFVFGEYY